MMECLNINDRVVSQPFVAKSSPNGGDQWISFPQAFRPGTTPMVWTQIDKEEGSPGNTRVSPLSVNSSGDGASIQNNGFLFQPTVIIDGGTTVTTSKNWTLQVLAIGVM